MRLRLISLAMSSQGRKVIVIHDLSNVWTNFSAAASHNFETIKHNITAHKIEENIDSFRNMSHSTPKFITETDALMRRIKRMQSQQTKETYVKRNYFQDILQTRSNISIDRECRSEMLIWMKKVSDHLNFANHTVFYSADYLDRFLSQTNKYVQETIASRRLYQLLSMTCFYIAVKIHETTVIGLDFLVAMSPFTREEFQDMELKVLSILNWNLYGPLAISFVDLYLELIFQGTEDSETKAKVLNLVNEELLETMLDDSISLNSTCSQVAELIINRISSKLPRKDDIFSDFLSFVLQSMRRCSADYSKEEDKNLCSGFHSQVKQYRDRKSVV